MIKNQIMLANEQNVFAVDEKKLIKVANQMLDFLLESDSVMIDSALNKYDLDVLSVNFDVLICDNSMIQTLNNDYRGKDQPTDVLSFAVFADSPMKIITDNIINLGEIIISAEKINSQSIENEKSFEEELYFLLSHGILHLLGFDHRDDEELEFMINLQQQMMENAC